MYLILFLIFFPKYDCYKILVFNHVFVSSHSNFMVKIANLLSDAGHNVTIIQSPMNKEIDDSNIKGPKIVAPSKRNPDIDAKSSVLNRVNEQSWTQNNENPIDIINELKDTSEWLASSCEHTIKDPNLTVKMREENFDLGISEIFAPCGLGVLKYYNVRNTITVSSGAYFDSNYAALGLPVPVSQLSTTIAPLPQEMNMFERLINLISFMAEKKVYNDALEVGNAVFKKVYPEGQIDLHKLFKETAYFIINSDPLVSYGTPSTPKFLQLGGFLNSNPKPLSEKWNKLLNERKTNVLVSFGSIVKPSKMTNNMKNNLFRLFKEHPNITFLCKYDEKRPELLNKVDNVYIYKWLPQYDLLADPRLNLFVTHGGMNSLLEAAKFGVPMLDIPLFGDQSKNAKTVEELKLGRSISKYDFDKDYDKLKNVFNDLMNNKIYLDTSKKISLMMAQRPYDPKTLFLKYVEFAAKFGRIDHFTIPGADIPYWKFLYIDVMTIFIGTLCLIFFITKMVIKNIKKIFFNNKKNQKID